MDFFGVVLAILALAIAVPVLVVLFLLPVRSEGGPGLDNYNQVPSDLEAVTGTPTSPARRRRVFRSPRRRNVPGWDVRSLQKADHAEPTEVYSKVGGRHPVEIVE